MSKLHFMTNNKSDNKIHIGTWPKYVSKPSDGDVPFLECKSNVHTYFIVISVWFTLTWSSSSC